LGAGGVATFSTASLPVTTGNPNVITAIYEGDSNFSGSSSNGQLQTVTRAASNTALSTSAATIGFNGSVTFTATVSSAGGSPTGTVTFDDGGASIGTGTLNGNSTATFTTSSLSASASPHLITAVYGGDTNFSGSASNTVTQ